MEEVFEEENFPGDFDGSRKLVSLSSFFLKTLGDFDSKITHLLVSDSKPLLHISSFSSTFRCKKTSEMNLLDLLNCSYELGNYHQLQECPDSNTILKHGP